MLIILQEWFGVVSCVWETVCRCSQSVVYSEDTMEEALKRVKSMRADMGGTEILQPLKHIYSQPCYPDHPRQVQHTLTESFRKTNRDHVLLFCSLSCSSSLMERWGTLKRFWIWWRVTFTLTGVFSRLSLYWHHSRLGLCDIDQK